MKAKLSTLVQPIRTTVAVATSANRQTPRITLRQRLVIFGIKHPSVLKVYSRTRRSLTAR